MLKKQPKRKKGQKAVSALQKKKNNSNSGYWKKKADKARGAYMHHFFRTCMVCGKSANETKLDDHHLVSRSNVFLRHSIENQAMLCFYDHKHNPVCSPHAGPIGFTIFLQENYPDKYQWVIENQHKTGKPNYEESYHLLKEMLEDAGGTL